MWEWLDQLLLEAIRNDTQLILFAILLVSAIIVLDAITKVAKLQRKKAGLNFAQISSALPGQRWIEANDMVSTKLSLAGRPDGLLIENGITIPVEFKPLAKKIRDRYIIQMLVYLRLVEELTGKKPPYGYLILGKKSKQVKIYNDDKKQTNLTSLIERMSAIANDQLIAIAAPAESKCANCPVREECRYKF